MPLMWSQRRRTGLPCAFEYGGDPLAAPNTHRLEAVASLPAFELVTGEALEKTSQLDLSYLPKKLAKETAKSFEMANWQRRK